jgi:hypothetical protein
MRGKRRQRLRCACMTAAQKSSNTQHEAQSHRTGGARDNVNHGLGVCVVELCHSVIVDRPQPLVRMLMGL